MPKQVIETHSNLKWYERIDVFTLVIGSFYFSQVMASCYSRIIITHLELRYGVPTEFAGNVSSFYASGAILCYFSLFFIEKYLKKNRPRYILMFHYIAMMGSLFISFVHFFSGDYDHNKSLNLVDSSDNNDESGSEIQSLCLLNNTKGYCSEEDQTQLRLASNDLYLTKLFYLGEFLMGFGVSCLWPLGYTFIDDHSAPGKSALYYSIIASILMFGWGLSYTMASYFSKVWLNFPEPAPEGITYEDNNRWVGAWWLGYCSFVVIMSVVSIPMWFFGSDLPSQWRYEGEDDVKIDNEETKILDNEENQELNKAKERFDSLSLPRKILRILSNKYAMCIVANDVLDSYGMQINFFVPKYMQRMWEIDISKATIISAYRAPIMAVTSFFGGLFFVKIMKVNAHSGKKFVIGVSWLCLLSCYVCMMLGCQNRDIMEVGLSNKEGELPTEDIEACNCREGRYQPVCTEGGVEYITACRALCQDSFTIKEDDEEVIFYTGCLDTNSTLSKSYCPTSEDIQENCIGSPMMLVYVQALSSCLSTFVNGVNTMITVGSAPPEEKVMTLTVFKISGKLLSNLWAAKVVGWLIDQTCILIYMDDCDGTGNCLLYDKEKMRVYIFGFSAILITFGTICHSGIMFFTPRKNSPSYVCKKEVEKSDDCQKICGVVI